LNGKFVDWVLLVLVALCFLLFRMVERSDLAALEFLMSKQPRGRVRVSEGNTVGARASNIFAEVDKFQKRFQDMKQKSATRESQVTDDST
jgi:hypothetical protein